MQRGCSRMTKDGTSGDAIMLAEYRVRKACGGELLSRKDWGKIPDELLVAAWKEICREAISSLIVIKGFRAAKKVSKNRRWYKDEHAALREPIPAEFFRENVAFGPGPPYPLYYADNVSGSIFDAPCRRSGAPSSNRRRGRAPGWPSPRAPHCRYARGGAGERSE
jgi:hypothetical protein